MSAALAADNLIPSVVSTGQPANGLNGLNDPIDLNDPNELNELNELNKPIERARQKTFDHH